MGEGISALWESRAIPFVAPLSGIPGDRSLESFGIHVSLHKKKKTASWNSVGILIGIPCWNSVGTLFETVLDPYWNRSLEFFRLNRDPLKRPFKKDRNPAKKAF